MRWVILSAILTATIFYFLNIIYYNDIINKVQSLMVYSQQIYEVKYSKEEAVSWVPWQSFALFVQPGQTRTQTITWTKGYPTRMKVSLKVDISPGEYYSCTWYECADCYIYKYDVCSQYQCVIKETTTNAVCERQVIISWQCNKTVDKGTYYINKVQPALSVYYVDDPGGILDPGEVIDTKADEIQITGIPDIQSWYNQVSFSPFTENVGECTVTHYLEKTGNYYACFYVENSKTAYYVSPECLYNNQNKIKVYIEYSDGEKTRIYKPYWFFEWYNTTAGNMLLICFQKDVLTTKQPQKIILDIRDIESQCSRFNSGDKPVSGAPAILRVEVHQTDEWVCSDLTKSEKTNYENQGFYCSAKDTIIETKTFKGTSDCSIVSYTNDPNQEDLDCSDGSCYWYCPPEYECLQPTTKEVQTVEAGTTYTATNKQDLYAKGCTDEDISCLSWTSKTGTYEQYLADKNYYDARNPSCYQWSSTTYNSPTDKTKLTGEPPYTQCIQRTSNEESPPSYARCTGPLKTSVVQPVTIKVANIERKFYSSSEDEFEVDLQPMSTIQILITGPQFSPINKGSATVTINTQVLEQNPYIVSQSVEDITPPGATYKAARYTATIYSPGDLYAKFYPPICPKFESEGLKYRFGYLNDNPLPGDPCAKQGILLQLNKGNNVFKIEAFSIDPSRFPSCTQKPNTCEEEDLYGCPEQCKIETLEIQCPSTLTVPAKLGGEVSIPITIKASNEGIVRITLQGKGVVPPSEVKRLQVGTNLITLKATYYLSEKDIGTHVWKVIVENPAIVGTQKIKPSYSYCEIRVTVTSEQVINLIKRPEVIISLAIILLGVILLLFQKPSTPTVIVVRRTKPKPKP